MMATLLETNESAPKKRDRQNFIDPETCCQKCDAVRKKKIMCNGCKL